MEKGRKGNAGREKSIANSVCEPQGDVQKGEGVVRGGEVTRERL